MNEIKLFRIVMTNDHIIDVKAESIEVRYDANTGNPSLRYFGAVDRPPAYINAKKIIAIYEQELKA